MTEKDSQAAAATRPGNLLRELSDQTVLETIFREGPITRPELAARTSLSKPTVSDAVRRLMQERLIRSAGMRSGKLGRSPISYVVDDAAGYVIGVDVGGTNIRIATVDLYGQLLSSRTVKQRTDGGRTLAEQVHTVVREAVRATGATHSQLLAIGASRMRTSQSPQSDEASEDPFEQLRERSDVPVLIDHSINLSAIGEKWRGLASGVSDFAFVSVGASVGVGIVMSDELVRGAHLTAGNVASLPESRSSPKRRPGSSGAMDAASLLEEARGLRWAGDPPDSIADIFARLDTEPSARKLLKAEAERIAFAVATICAVVDPELIVLGGGIGSFPELLEPVREATRALMGHPARIESSLLRDQAALYGALAAALSDAHDQLFRRGPVASSRPATV
jgi:predicted NBD/HSP70 family sugar kinase